MLVVDLLLRWIHILSAVAMAGGAMFVRFPLAGARAELPSEVRESFNRALRARWSRWVMACSGLLLLSGFINFGFAVTRYDLNKDYHMLFGIKFLLAMVIFTIAALLTGRTSAAEKLRTNERFWASLNVLLAVIVICLGGMMRFAERRPKPDGSASLDSRPQVLVEANPID